MPEGRQSPSPEESKPEQIEIPSGGHGADQSSHQEQKDSKPEEQLHGLESNPKDVRADDVQAKFAKKEGN